LAESDIRIAIELFSATRIIPTQEKSQSWIEPAGWLPKKKTSSKKGVKRECKWCAAGLYFRLLRIAYLQLAFIYSFVNLNRQFLLAEASMNPFGYLSFCNNEKDNTGISHRSSPLAV
jgi:hypothetical protein